MFRAARDSTRETVLSTALPHSSIWAITTYFNPARYRSRRENYRIFREGLRSQGVPLLTVEWAPGDADHELKSHDAEHLLQFRSDDVLWHKERLLNLAVAALPETCQAIAWIDADVTFEDPDWAENALQMLQTHAVIQPFSKVIRLPQGATPPEYPGSRIGWRIRQGHRNGTWTPSFCSLWNNPARTLEGTTGYVWAARREFISDVGLYDRCIVGGADRILALAFAMPWRNIPASAQRIRHAPLIEDIRPWHETVFDRVQGNLGFLAGVIHHHWHGESEHRQYVDRHAVLEQFQYDPRRDVGLDSQGLLTWTSDKPALHAGVRAYLSSRREDG